MEPAGAEDPITTLTRQVAELTQTLQGVQARQLAMQQREFARNRRTADARSPPSSPPLEPAREIQAAAPEPPVPMPERFSGDRAQFWTFITSCELMFSLQPRTYATQITRVRTAIALLGGRPRSWAHQLLREDSPVLANWDTFTQAMGTLYDDPLRAAMARDSLRALRQGRRPVEDFVAEFRELSSDTGLNEVALLDQFRLGLSDPLRDELARLGVPETLEDLILLVTRLDRRLRERRQERQQAPPESRRPTFSRPSPPVSTVPSPSPVDAPEPMQIGMVRGPLTPAERSYRRQHNLCLYCGQSGHQLRQCPARPAPGKDPLIVSCLGLPMYSATSHLTLPISLQWEGKRHSLVALIDSGASSCFLDLNLALALQIPTKEKKTPCLLHMVDGSTLKTGPVTLESLPVTLSAGPSHSESIIWDIVPSPLFPVILGINWLRANNPLIDWSTGTLGFSGSPARPSVLPAGTPPTMLAATQVVLPAKYQDFQDVFEKKEAERLPPHRDYDCAIELLPGAPLPYGRIYNLSEPESQELKRYIAESLAKGFIRPSTSPLGASIFFVGKKDGGLRPCIDYRALNQITVKNRYPLPLIPELLDRVRDAHIFSKIDLRGAYNLVRIQKNHEWKTAFRCRYGHFEYLVMPFGLCNAPATFQSFINDIFQDILDVYVVAYLDDILIFSSTLEEHERHVREVLRRLRQNRLYGKLEKCQFEVSRIEFLGYILSPGQVEMDPKKIQTILKWPVPTNRKKVQQFMGFANFYRRFIRNFSKLCLPITQLTRVTAPFVWTSEAQDAFDSLRIAFTRAPILAQPNSHLPFYLESDASDLAVGAVLSQKTGDKQLLHPLAFFSRKLTSAERNYPIGEKELLAIKVALEEWRHLLEGARHPVTVYTDHRNLEYLRTARRLRPRQARWALFFSRFQLQITFRPGSRNGKADALSRLHEDDPGPRNHQEPILPAHLFLATRQTLKDQLQPFDSSPPTEMEGLLDSHGVRFRGRQIYAPPVSRLAILQHFHDSRLAGHPGTQKTLELVRRSFWWPEMSQEIQSYVRSCTTCARSKAIPAKPMGLLQPLPVPQRPWRDVAIDFIVDLPPSDHYTCILVVVDRHSKMGHFIPTKGLPTAKLTAELFIREIFRLHGLPNSLISDRGSQFTSRFWKYFCKGVGIQHLLSSGYHPQTNGQTERTNQTLERYLRCFSSYAQDDWSRLLPLAEFAFNNTQSSSTGTSPFYANYGYHPSSIPELPINPTCPEAALSLQELQSTHRALSTRLLRVQEGQKRQADKKRRPAPGYQPGDKVWLSTANLRLSCPSKKLGPRFIGPYPILDVISPAAVRLLLPPSVPVHPVFHVSQLKPWHADPFPGRALLPPPPVIVDGSVEYEVQDILDSRIRRGVLEYLVHWKGYGPDERTWEPLSHLHAEKKRRRFHLRFPTKPGPEHVRRPCLGGGSLSRRGPGATGPRRGLTVSRAVLPRPVRPAASRVLSRPRPLARPRRHDNASASAEGGRG